MNAGEVGFVILKAEGGWLDRRGGGRDVPNVQIVPLSGDWMMLMRHLRGFTVGMLATAGLLLGGCPAATTPVDGNLDGDASGGKRTLSGAIIAPESAKWAPRAQAVEATFGVIVQSAETGKTYAGQTDDNGDFSIEIPDDETGDTFAVTVLTPEGQPAGPVIFGQAGSQGFTGLDLSESKDLGTVMFPQDNTATPILPGDDSDVTEDDVDGELVARLDDNGVPVGVSTFGRGDDALADGGSNAVVDRDRDGMIDLFDADDDGDGTVDDFDDDAVLNPGEADGVNVNFFMNLKIDDVQATAYFSGDTAGIETSLKTDTVITFEVSAQASLGKNITAARIIAPPAPAPSYLPIMTLATTSPSTLWSTASYALRPDGTNHFQEWVVPNDFMNTGDTFTVEISYDDGTVGVYSRMINYVFKSIPKLINVGPPGALVAFNGPAEIEFDGTQDLAFEWAPPVDDFGHLMVAIPYRFEVFYYDTHEQQIDGITAATWATAIPNWQADNQSLEIDGSTLTTLSAGNTFTVQMPKEIFVDTVQTASGPVDVGSYKVDIAAQQNGNNSALMLRLRKS